MVNYLYLFVLFARYFWSLGMSAELLHRQGTPLLTYLFSFYTSFCICCCFISTTAFSADVRIHSAAAFSTKCHHSWCRMKALSIQPLGEKLLMIKSTDLLKRHNSDMYRQSGRFSWKAKRYIAVIYCSAIKEVWQKSPKIIAVMYTVVYQAIFKIPSMFNVSWHSCCMWKKWLCSKVYILYSESESHCKLRRLTLEWHINKIYMRGEFHSSTYPLSETWESHQTWLQEWKCH